MENKVNIFLEFNHVQFSADIDTVVENYLRRYDKEKYKKDRIEGLSKEQLVEELTGRNPLSSLTKSAVQNAVEMYNFDNLVHEGPVVLRGADKLDKVVGEFKGKENTKFMILTKSRYPNAIKALYEINGIENLKDLQILPNHEEFQNKNETIAIIEDKALKEGADKVCNIFIHHDNDEIESFRKDRNPGSNIGIHVTNGVSERTIKKLKNAVLYVNSEESIQSKLRDLTQSDITHKGIDNLLRTDLEKIVEKILKNTDHLSEASSTGKKEKGALQAIKDLFTKRKGSDSDSTMLLDHDVLAGATGGTDLSKLTEATNKKQQKPRRTSESPTYTTRSKTYVKKH